MTNQNDNSLRTLLELVHADPDLQAQLFNLKDAGDFIAEVQQLAASHELNLDTEAIRQAMRTGQMNWIERRLP